MSDQDRDRLIAYCRAKHEKQYASFKKMSLVATVIVAIAVVVISSNLFLAAIASPVFYYGIDWIYEQSGNRDYIQLVQRLETPEFRQFMANNGIRPTNHLILAAFHRYKRHLKILNFRTMAEHTI